MDDRALALAFSSEFQRLRYVRLCNINSLFLTGASEPKRFEHCVGVYHLANLWSRARALTPAQADIVRAAALLHDLLTAPFGHSFEYVMVDNPFDQRFDHANLLGGTKAGFHQKAQAAAHFAGRPFSVRSLLGSSADEVYSAILGEGPFGPLISGSLDLDNLDNVVRLAFHMGLCGDEDRMLPMKLAPLLGVHQGRLGAAAGAEPLMWRWFAIRKRLYELLLLDRGEFAAKAMLTLAVELAADAGLLGPDDWKLTDDGLLTELEARSVGEHQFISQTVKRLRVGHLFDCVEVWQSEETASYPRLSESRAKRALERSIDQRMAEDGGSKLRVCLHYVLDQKKTCRSLSYHDFGIGGERGVGYDSDKLLVGVFVTNARAGKPSRQELRRMADVIRTVLEEAGAGRLVSAPEPLSELEVASDLFGP